MLINFPILWFLRPVANFSLKLRVSISIWLRLMLEMLLTRSTRPKFFQQLLLHKDINLDLSLEMWLLFILNISDLSCSAMLWDNPCFRRSSSPKSLALSNVYASENFYSRTEDSRYMCVYVCVCDSFVCS